MRIRPLNTDVQVTGAEISRAEGNAGDFDGIDRTAVLKPELVDKFCE
jgi:hypothetical protein